MKISQKTIQYILLALIVVIAFCAYQFGYVKFIESANKVKTENKAIEARINDLTDKETHRAEWTEGIDSTDSRIKELLAKYGPGNTPEKSIMFVKSLEEEAGMTVSSIAFNPDTVVFASEDVDENGLPVTELDSTFLSLSYITTYEGLKKCVDYINNYPERMNVSGFDASYDQETGQLSGSMIVNLFGVKDADHKYVAPNVQGVGFGVDNIFGNVEVTIPEGGSDTAVYVPENQIDDYENGEGTGEGTSEGAGE